MLHLQDEDASRTYGHLRKCWFMRFSKVVVMTPKMVSMLLYVNVMQLSWSWKWHCSLCISLSFSPSLSKIDNSSRWVRMIESGLLLEMKNICWRYSGPWGLSEVQQEVLSLSLLHNLDGLSTHLSNSQALLSASAIPVFGLDQIKYERGRQEGREKRSHPLAPLIFSISRPNLTTQHLILIMLAQYLSLLHPLHFYIFLHSFCNLFVFNTWHP